jgi:hypothetical protein
MKRITPLKLTFAGALVAALGVGCASTGYARYDADSTHQADVGVAASAETGTDRDMNMASHSSIGSSSAAIDESAEGEARATVSALSFNPDTRATWVNKFPFYDQNWNISVIQTYTFAAPDPTLEVASSADLPQFSQSLPPGSVYVEAAGGAGEVRTGRVIQHSPNPR